MELNLNAAELDEASGATVDLRAASLDVLRVFAREKAVWPYITLGMGALRSQASGAPDDTNFMAQAGAGVMLRLARNESGTRTFTLRPELKAPWDDAGRLGYFRDYVATLGFEFSFEARGYGESMPIGDNRALEDRARNRRVVMSVLENPDNVDVEGQSER